MCGRFGISTDIENLQDFFVFDPSSVDYIRRYNIAPTDPVLTYGALGPETAEYMRWGLIPSWWKTDSDRKLPPMINARAETLTTNNMFKDAFQRKRCLILSNGFYEWRKNDDGSTTPFRIGITGWEPFGMAGLWDAWSGPNGWVHSCTIITTTPNELTAEIHDRMPVILPPAFHDEWLASEQQNMPDLSRLLIAHPAKTMTMYEISSAIGSVRNDYSDLIQPVSQIKLL